jgi:hypothetical protein
VSSRLTERDAKRYLFLAQRKGDAAGAARYSAALESIRGGRSAGPDGASSAAESPPERAISGPVSGVRAASSGIARFYDEHPKAVLGTTVAVSAVAGIKLNEKVGGTVTPLELQPSSVAGLGFLATAVLMRQFDMKRTSNVAFAAALGQGIATVNAHVPGGGLMAPKKSPVV